MSSGNQIDAVIETLKDPEVRVPPVYVQKKGENRETEKYVKHVVEVPLLFDDKCMSKHTTGWNDFHQSREPNAYIWANQICMGMIEKSGTMGSSFCKINPHSDPKRYWACVAAYLKRKTGVKLSTMETNLLRSFVSQKLLFDPGFQHDAEQLEKKIKADKEEEKKKAAALKRKQNREEDEDDEEEEFVDDNVPVDNGISVVRAKATIVSKLINISNSMLDGQEMRCFGNHIISSEHGVEPVRGQPIGTGNIMDTLTDDQLSGRASCQSVLLQQSHTVLSAEQKDKDAPAKSNAIVPWDGPRIMEKVSFTVSPIYDAHEKAIGCWVRFLIRDPQMNPGDFFNEVLANVSSRKDKLNNPMSKHWELFPGYMTKYKTAHPFGDNMSDQTYRTICEQISPGITKDSLFVDMCVKSSPTHMYKLFDTAHAINVFEKAGGVGLGRATDWFSDEQAHFPLKTWKYKAEQALWYSKEYIGLCEQDFPFIGSNAKFLQSLVTASNIKDFMNARSLEDIGLEDVEQQVNDAFNSVDKELSKLLINRRALKDSNLLDYDTPNQFIHLRAKSKVIYNRLQELFPPNAYETGAEVHRLMRKHRSRWREFADDEVLERVEEYEVYSAALHEAQDEMLKDYCNLWNPDAATDELPISDPIKVMLKWYKKNEHEFPNVTRHFTLWDPELDMFGNTMIQQLHIYVHFARILQPIICMLSEGLFSCYDHDMKELTFNMMVHGRYDTGKTYTAIKTLIDFTAIPGTVSEFSLSTKAADVTKKHSYDEIIASDECPEWMVSSEEGKKNQDQVNKEKIKYTRGQIAQRTFAYVTLPNGDKVRWNEDIVSDHKRSCVFVTNHAVEAKGPLSSRMFRHTMKQTTIPANEMKGYMDERLTKDAQTWLRLNQYLTTCAKKAAQTGAIYPHVQMDLFDDVANKVFSYLKDWGNISDDAGKRSLDIMRPYARQLIYKMAIRYTFDLPGSIHYEKQFSTHMIQDVQKYLYSTVPIVWWTLTACATEWIDDDDANIIRALIADSNCGWNYSGENPYDVYVNDHQNLIPFKVVDPNGKAGSLHRKSHKVTQAGKDNDPAGGTANSRPDPDEKNPEMLHLDYLTCTGTIEQISRRACTFTNPRMGYDDFYQGLKRLNTRNIKLDGGGYKPQPVDLLKYWHRWTVQPDGSNPDFPAGRKKTGWGCPKEYMTEEEKQDNDNQTIDEYRTEDNIPKRGPNALLPVVDLSDMCSRRLHFIPNAVKIFQQDVLLKALWSAITCASMREGKYLQGFPDQHQPTYMSVSYFDQIDIETHIDQLDADSGYTLGPGGQPVFLDETVPEHMRPVSRRVGIAFNQRGGLTEEEQEASIAQSWAPKKAGDTSWKESYKNGASSMSKTSEIIEDLNFTSALKQHMITGQPIDSPVQDEKYLQAQYERVCRAKKFKTDLNMDYPSQFLQGRKVLNRHWDMAGGNSSSVKRRSDTNMKIVFQKSAASRADRKRIRDSQIAERQRMPPPARRPAPPAPPKRKKHRPAPPKQVYTSSSDADRRDITTSALDY